MIEKLPELFGHSEWNPMDVVANRNKINELVEAFNALERQLKIQTARERTWLDQQRAPERGDLQ